MYHNECTTYAHLGTKILGTHQYLLMLPIYPRKIVVEGSVQEGR